MTIDTGGKMVVDATCQLEIEWDGATVQNADGTPAQSTDILNNGTLDLRAGGVLQNDGVVTIEGTEGKPYQGGTGETATKSEKGQGELTIREGATFINNGSFMPNGSLYVLGTLENKGKYSDVISSNDPDKGLFTYHKGIQSTWKDDVTQKNVMYGGIYVNLTKQFLEDNAIWQPQPDAKGLIKNSGDIVLCPGELVNMGTIENNKGAHISSCATDKAVIPIEPDPNNPTVVTKEVTFDTPKGSFINNYAVTKDCIGTIVNEGDIMPAYVTVNENGNLGTLETQNVQDKFKDRFVYLSADGKLTGSGFLYKHDFSRAKIAMTMGDQEITAVPYDGMAWNPYITAIVGEMEYYDTYGDFTVKYFDPSGNEIKDEDVIDAGTYNIALGEGTALKGAVTKTLTVEPTVLGAATLDADTYTYDGEVHKPEVKSVTATFAGRALAVPASGYDVVYSNENPKDAGTYSVTIKGKGNFTGSITKTFTIVKPAPDVSRPEITAVELDAYTYSYDGAIHKPTVTSVKAGDKDLQAKDYDVVFSSEEPTNADTYTVTVYGKGGYRDCVKDVTFKIEPAKLTAATLSATAFAYDGKVHKPTLKSVAAGSLVVPATGYTASYSAASPKNAGKNSVTVTGKGNYTGAIASTFKINQGVNTLVVEGKTAKVKKAVLAKKAKTYERSDLMQVTKAQGTTTYALKGVNKAKFKSYFKVAKKTGAVTVKQGLKKGAYKVSVKVKAAGNANYKAATRTVAFTVKVVA